MTPNRRLPFDLLSAVMAFGAVATVAARDSGRSIRSNVGAPPSVSPMKRL